MGYSAFLFCALFPSLSSLVLQLVTGWRSLIGCTGGRGETRHIQEALHFGAAQGSNLLLHPCSFWVRTAGGDR